MYNLETKHLITSRNVHFDEDFRFVEGTTGADGKPAWLLIKLDADTTAVESQFSHADGLRRSSPCCELKKSSA